MHTLRTCCLFSIFSLLFFSSPLPCPAAASSASNTCVPCTIEHPKCKHPGSKPSAWCKQKCSSKRNSYHCPAYFCFCPLGHLIGDKRQQMNINSGDDGKRLAILNVRGGSKLSVNVSVNILRNNSNTNGFPSSTTAPPPLHTDTYGGMNTGGRASRVSLWPLITNNRNTNGSNTIASSDGNGSYVPWWMREDEQKGGKNGDDAEKGSSGGNGTSDGRSSVQRKAPEFEFKIGHDEAGCQGVVIFRRNATCPSKAAISHDAWTNVQFKNKYGPDAFYVKIIGPEMVVARMRHQSNCEYHGTYQLTLPGVYTVEAQHVYKDYTAVTEAHDKRRGSDREILWWYSQRRYLKNVYITNHSVELRCQYPTKDADIQKYLRQHLRTAPANGTVEPLDVRTIQLIQSAKPACTDGPSLSEGRWINTSKNGSIYEHNWQWCPYTCSLTTMNWNTTQAFQCLHDKVVQVLGDSQQRRMFYAFSNFLRENKVTGNPKYPKFELRINGTRTKLQYNIDMYLDRFLPVMHKRGLDALFVGYGNWPASGTHKWPISKYRKHLKRVGRIVEGFAKRNPKAFVLWLGMPAYPYPFRMDSRRSNERLEFMVELAESEMEKRRIPILRPFGITEAMLEYTVDGNHLIGLPTDIVGAAMMQLYCQHVARRANATVVEK